MRENRQHGLMRGDAVLTDGVPHSTNYFHTENGQKADEMRGEKEGSDERGRASTREIARGWMGS